MNSSRYYGKPLIDIDGLPMVEHVRRRTLMCNAFYKVIVATCDVEIFNCIEKHGGEGMMTSKLHEMASDRVAEVASHFECTHIVNVQGDEILTLPEDLTNFARNIKANPNTPYWCSIAKIQNQEELSDQNIVKCFITKSNRVFSCERNSSNYLNLVNFNPIRKLLGVFGYKRSALFDYWKLARTPMEINQRIDIMRIIENDLPVKGIEFKCEYPGINDKKEEEYVRKIMKEDLEQKKINSKVLAGNI